MGTVSEKLAYLSDTKAAIRNAIADKGVAVTDADTFRSYADKIRLIDGGSPAPIPVIELLFNDDLQNTGSGDYTVTSSGAEILYENGPHGKCYSATNKSGIEITDVSALLLSDFTITFLTKINNSGLSPYPQYRRLVWWKANSALRGLEVSYSGSTSTNKPDFSISGGNKSGNVFTAINDGSWHSILIVQRGNVITTTIDGAEQIVCNNCVLSSVGNYLCLSHDSYTLNGYISSFRVFDSALSYAAAERFLALD